MSNDQQDRVAKNEVFTGQSSGNNPQGLPTRNVMKDDFGFEVPVESVPLPSKGATYSADSAMHGKELVSIKAMTAKEEDILTSKALIKKGTVISELLKSCVVEPGFDPDATLTGDRNALMVALRITGYGSEYKVEVDCPACGERSKQSFDLTQLPIKRLDIDPISLGANLFEVELPLTKKKVRWKFLTGKEEREMSQTQERKKKQGMLNDNLVTTRLTHSIHSVGEVTDKTKIGFFIRNMPARDSLFLRKYIDKNEPGIDMKSWMDCPSCLESSEVRLPLGASFFWPDTE
jgi:hypothetical protein